MEQNLLKEQLIKVKGNDYQKSEDINLYDTALAMLEYIGVIDPELRDDLIFSTFYYWIIEKKYLSPEQLSRLASIGLDNEHLLYKLGSSGDDSVFTRAFSALFVAVIIARHREEQFLSTEQFDQLKDKLIKYYQGEKDYRGYVEEKGWAHSIAHGADAIDELVQCPQLEKEDIISILKAVRAKIMIDSYVYINEEDERIVTALVKIINGDLVTTAEIKDWIRSFTDYSKPEYPAYHYLLTNIKGLLRSLYFRLLKEEQKTEILDEIKDTLEKLSNFN